MRSMYWQLGILGTISAFASGHRETKKNLCRDGRSQDLPSTDLQPTLINQFPYINPLKPNDHYSGRTASLTSKRCILYIYSTNVGTEYFKYGIYSPFFFLFKMQLIS